jgi:hypothetical protein
MFRTIPNQRLTLRNLWRIEKISLEIEKIKMLKRYLETSYNLSLNKYIELKFSVKVFVGCLKLFKESFIWLSQLVQEQD